MNYRNTSPTSIDQISIKESLLAYAPAWQQPKAKTCRAIYDIAFDWVTVFVAVLAVHKIGWTITPIALVVIGNRQRALGNLLHEASHGNLSQRRDVNDYLAHLLLAAPLLGSLNIYRELHARHHAWLGDSQRDPDLLPSLAHDGDRWFEVYARCLSRPSLILGSLAGHLAAKKQMLRHRLGILAWWSAMVSALFAVNAHFAAVFLALWFGARVTVFHAITIFREMTDHYGLKSGGIFSYTREIPDHGMLSTLIHPHHNGYHLTHHLFPAVPYHQLPELHAQLLNLSIFNERGIVCPTYFDGYPSSVFGWGSRHG